MPAKISYNEFVDRVYNKFGKNVIDLSNINSNNFKYSNKYEFKCNNHNCMFETYPKILLRSKYCCPICRSIIASNCSHKLHNANRNPITISKLLDKLDCPSNISIDKSSISTNSKGYVIKKNPIRCICDIHGEFYISASNLLRSKHICSKCAKEHSRKKNIEHGVERRKSFIEQARHIHGNQYDYSLVDITGKLSKVKIICSKHGIFEMFPSNHVCKGEGCPKCNNIQTNCERRLGVILRQYFPDDMIIEQYHGEFGRQSLDFYFPKYRIGVEYQGSQHFEYVSWLSDNRHSYEHIRELDDKKFRKSIEIGVKIFYFTFNRKYENIEYFDKIYFYIEDLIRDINKQMDKCSSE